MTTRAWVYALVAAAIGGAASSLLSALAMPDAFNMTHDGLIHIAKAAMIGAAVPVLTLLKQSPLPIAEVTSTTTTTASVKTTVEGTTQP